MRFFRGILPHISLALSLCLVVVILPTFSEILILGVTSPSASSTATSL